LDGTCWTKNGIKNEGCVVWEMKEYGRFGMWKVRSVEKEERDNSEVWKMGRVENEECGKSATSGKCAVRKMLSIENKPYF